MSVCLKRLETPSGDVEIWAPDYDVDRIWLCDDDGFRVDLSISQAKKLRDYLIELLPR